MSPKGIPVDGSKQAIAQSFSIQRYNVRRFKTFFARKRELYRCRPDRDENGKIIVYVRREGRTVDTEEIYPIKAFNEKFKFMRLAGEKVKFYVEV